MERRGAPEGTRSSFLHPTYLHCVGCAKKGGQSATARCLVLLFVTYLQFPELLGSAVQTTVVRCTVPCTCKDSHDKGTVLCKEDVTGFRARRQKKMIRAARWQIRQNGWLCLESRDRPREGRTGRVLIAGCQTAGYRHSQRRVVCTSRQREDESAAELEARKSLPSPVDWPKMNEGGCTGPENETRRKGLSAACCWIWLDAFLCLLGRAP